MRNFIKWYYVVLFTLFLSCIKDEPVVINPDLPTCDIIALNESVLIDDVNYLRERHDVSYGDHEREVYDKITKKCEYIKETLVLFHGGAYTRFDKDTLYTDDKYAPIVADLLDNGVRIINANYKYLEDIGLENPIGSGRTLLDTIIDEYGPVYVGGVSAGAGISLWNGLQRDDVKGIIALEMQDLDVRQWEDVFPGLNVDVVLEIPQFDMLYKELYGATQPSEWSLDKVLGNGVPLYVMNSVDRPFVFPQGLFDIDNLYHNVNHATLFVEKAKAAGHEVTTAGTIKDFILQ